VTVALLASFFRDGGDKEPLAREQGQTAIFRCIALAEADGGEHEKYRRAHGERGGVSHLSVLA